MNLIEARKINIGSFLAYEGYEPQQRRGNQSWYLSPIVQHGDRQAAFEVNTQRNEWFDFQACCGGDIVDLVMSLKKTTTTREAVHYLQESSVNFIIQEDKHILNKRQTADEMKQIQYVSLRHNALLSYLLRKKINVSIARQYCSEAHYTINGNFYFAMAFKNRSLGYELKNQYFCGCVGSNDISEIRQNDTIRKGHAYIFQNFLDFLTYQTSLRTGISYEQDFCDYIILNSINNLKKATAVLQEYDYIHGDFEKDEVGRHIKAFLHDHVNSILEERPKANISIKV